MPVTYLATPVLRVLLARGSVQLFALRQQRVRFAVMALMWGDAVECAVAVLGVVPVHEAVHPGAGLFQRVEGALEPQRVLGRAEQRFVTGSAKTVPGTLLIGGSYRFSDKRTVNFTLGVGVTRPIPR